MRVMFLNNDGGGYASTIEIAENMTVKQFFDKHMPPDAKPNNYLLRVNRMPSTPDQILCENDRITAVPLKIEGAC